MGKWPGYLLLCSLDLAAVYRLQSRPSAAAPVRFCGNGQIPIALLIGIGAGSLKLLVTARRQDGKKVSELIELHKGLLIQQAFAPFSQFYHLFTFAFPRSQVSDRCPIVHPLPV